MMANPDADNGAVACGYTRHVLIEISDCVFDALIRPDADLDGSFRAYDTDAQKWLKVNGWLISSIEDCV